MDKRKIIFIVIMVLLVGSLIGNAYWFGSQWLEEDRANAFNAGAVSMKNYIIQVAQDNGLVVLEDSEGQQLKLIKVNGE